MCNIKCCIPIELFSADLNHDLRQYLLNMLYGFRTQKVCVLETVHDADVLMENYCVK